MQRIAIQERPNWKSLAESLGFPFHTMYGHPYWDETACYRFTMKQIEDDLEDPSTELTGLCYEVADRAARDEEVLRKLMIPEYYWEMVSNSWLSGEGELYGRFDLRYDGNGPAKLYEYNADTPTSLYESSFFQWLWLEEAMEQGLIPQGCDQFNSIQERLIETFATMGSDTPLHLASCRDNQEDEGTVRYLQDCAVQAGVPTVFMYMDEIGLSGMDLFVDVDGRPIQRLFKLYPWEWMFEDDFGKNIPASKTQFIEPSWKAILSNKGLMPLLWEMFPGHPNLLPSYFENDPAASELSSSYIRKPLLSREGDNVTAYRNGVEFFSSDGVYGDGANILQELALPPEIDGNYPVIGSWIVNGQPCGIGIREDKSPVTRNLSRFLPHVIQD